MVAIPAPLSKSVRADVRRILSVGLSKAEGESLQNVAALVQASRRAWGDGMTLEVLLRKATERVDPGEALMRHLAVALDLDRTGLSPTERDQQIADAEHWTVSTVRTNKRTEMANLITGALLEIWDEAQFRVEARFDVSEELRERLSSLCVYSAVALALYQRPDGAWSRTGHEPDGEMSMTSQAALALHKVLGDDWAAPVLEQSLKWVREHRSPDQTGGHGEYHDVSRPPGFGGNQPAREILSRPRHTASAIKVYNQVAPETELRRVGLGVHFLLKSESTSAGWAESGQPDAPPDLLTTMYVLDALLAIQPSIRQLQQYLDDGQWSLIDNRFEVAVRFAIDWLVGRCNGGAWGSDRDSQGSPFITAQVLCFAWQAAMAVIDDVSSYLLTNAPLGGGVRARVNGPAVTGPTAMAMLGLLRATTDGHETFLRDAANYLGRCATAPELEMLDTFPATFLLLLGQPDPIFGFLTTDDWREDAGRAVAAISNARAAGASRHELVGHAETTLGVKHARARPLLRSLRDQP
jgi:hypothetical protein